MSDLVRNAEDRFSCDNAQFDDGLLACYSFPFHMYKCFKLLQNYLYHSLQNYHASYSFKTFKEFALNTVGN